MYKLQLVGASVVALSFSLIDAGVVTVKNPTVTLAAGPVFGTTTVLPSATAVVNKFLGVPFAQSPPVRFSPPQPILNRTTPYNATALKPACVQQFNYPEASRNFTLAVFNNPGGSPPVESEDCLYLNVFAPSTVSPAGGRTVMFWIYGGSLQFGYAGNLAYDGSSFAAYQDVIVVTANYRTNAFGFSNSPQIPLVERNVGLLDQRAALAWVQSNIAAFGGNPKMVTLFGESAGAFSIDKLITSIPKNPPFRAAILESGQSTVMSATANNDTGGLLAWESLANALNCTSTPDVLACVRAAPATTIKSIIEHAALDFAPVTDNVTQVSDPATRRAQRNIALVPVFSGSNSQEGRVFEVGQTNVTAFVQNLFSAVPAALQNEIVAAYPIGSPGIANDYEAISQIFTDVEFQCTAAFFVNTSAAARIPAYRYFFNASFPNTQSFPDAGVYHSSEIPIVFGTYAAANTTAQEVALSKYMQTAWANFAKNPTLGPGLPRATTNSDTRYIGDYGVNGSDGLAALLSPAQIDARCALYAPIYAATTI